MSSRSSSAQADFLQVTETPAQPISGEQLERLVNRYTWASTYCGGKDVVEVACGIGPGLGLLAAVARSVEAGDYAEPMVRLASRQYGNRIRISRFDAHELPFPDSSKDVIILFEAIYYLQRPERFVAECARVLREDGKVLIATANKDLWDFHPSAFSHRYFGVVELGELFARFRFGTEFFGFQAVDRAPLRQRLLRPVKRLAVASGLMPRTMAGKRWLRRLVFGAELPMPAELTPDMGVYVPPTPVPPGIADRRHKIIYCAATLSASASE